MMREQILERVRAFDADPGWYQDIDLKNGISTKTRRLWGEELKNPRERWRSIKSAFPAKFQKKSVLDLGCNAGYFSFKVADRGAARIVGVDLNPKYIEQAKFCNEVRGDNAEFRVGGVTPIEAGDREFDITLCIGLLYHVPDIFGAIKEISRVTRDFAIVESAIYEDDDTTPLMRVADQKGALPGIWHPNIAGLRKLFHLARFSRTEVLFKNTGRGGIVAYK